MLIIHHFRFMQLTLAKDAYERVLSTTPDHSKVLQHLGGIYLRESTPFHNPQKCIDYISQSLEHGKLVYLSSDVGTDTNV